MSTLFRYLHPCRVVGTPHVRGHDPAGGARSQAVGDPQSGGHSWVTPVRRLLSTFLGPRVAYERKKYLVGDKTAAHQRRLLSTCT